MDVVEKDIPEIRSENRTLKYHVEEFEWSGSFAVDENNGLACCKVLGKKGKKSWGESGVLKFLEKQSGVHMVESAFYVRKEHTDFAAVLKFVKPGVDEKCG